MRTSLAGRANRGQGPGAGGQGKVASLPTHAATHEARARAPNRSGEAAIPGPRPLAPGPCGTAAGITLIEMMAVVTIISIMIAVSAPSISAGLDSIRMTTATNEIASFLNSAVNRAQRRQEAIEIVISPRAGVLKMFSNQPGFEREFKLPDGIRIDAILPEAEEAEYRLILMPGTAVPGIGLELASSRGGRRAVRLDPMTGFPRVERLPSK